MASIYINEKVESFHRCALIISRIDLALRGNTAIGPSRQRVLSTTSRARSGLRKGWGWAGAEVLGVRAFSLSWDHCGPWAESSEGKGIMEREIHKNEVTRDLEIPQNLHFAVVNLETNSLWCVWL